MRMHVIVHHRIAMRHPGLCDDDVIYAWLNPTSEVLRTESPNFPEVMRVGTDRGGRLLELVGTLTEEGWLVYHAMTPPSKKTLRELDKARRRRRG